MATIISSTNKTKVLNQLDTYNHTTLTTNMYVVEVSTNGIPPSGLSVTIQQNGVTKATTTTPGNLQAGLDVRIILNCTIGDLISVILASSAAADQGGNAFKATLKITPGLV